MSPNWFNNWFIVGVHLRAVAEHERSVWRRQQSDWLKLSEFAGYAIIRVETAGLLRYVFHWETSHGWRKTTEQWTLYLKIPPLEANTLPCWENVKLEMSLPNVCAERWRYVGWICSNKRNHGSFSVILQQGASFTKLCTRPRLLEERPTMALSTT